MAVASSDEIGVPTFDEHACSILYNIHSLHVDDIESLRSPSVMQGIEPELRVACFPISTPERTSSPRCVAE
jgi:hypothetical protein